MAKKNLNPNENGKIESSVESDTFSVGGNEESEEEFPVGISWKESKNAFDKNEKQRKDAVDFLKSKDKEKRRKKNEMFVAQKRTKTSKMTFDLTKLPDEIVHAVAKNVKKVEEKQPKKVSKKIKKSKRKSLPKKMEGFNVLLTKDEVKKPKKNQEAAAKFLENHLYGNRLQRTSTTSNLTLKFKSFGQMKPAIKFSG